MHRSAQDRRVRCPGESQVRIHVLPHPLRIENPRALRTKSQIELEGRPIRNAALRRYGSSSDAGLETADIQTVPGERKNSIAMLQTHRQVVRSQVHV